MTESVASVPPPVDVRRDPAAPTETPRDLPTAAATHAAVTWRSLLVGTVGVLLVCALTPYNDIVLSDTSLAAGYFPLAFILLSFLLIVGINAPLHRFSPAHALRTGELAVVTLMLLVGCSLPNWGLMRFLAPTPAAPFHIGAGDGQFWKAFTGLDLPRWLFPVSDVASGRSDPVVGWFYSRVPAGERIPWSAWVLPLLAWGTFAMAMLATLAALARLLVTQWQSNERLPFPLVQVESALIEVPERGSAFNELFRSRTLWIAACAVFAIHALTCLNGYYPQRFPKIPLSYDFNGIFADEPFVYLRPKIKRAALSFIVVGVTYFIRSRTAFSLWAIYLMVSLFEVQQQALMHREVPQGMWADQTLGASLAFIGGVVWIGRGHWATVLRNAFWRGGSDNTYRTAFWIAVAGIAVMLAWLKIVGVQLWVAALIVAFILLAHLVVARVVAETGLPFFRSGVAASQVYTNFPVAALGGRDVYFASVFTILGPLTTRDGLLTFATHGLGVCRNADVGPREQRKLGLTIAWALGVGFVVAAAATLYCQYSYATPIQADQIPARNYFGAEYIPRRDMAQAVIAHSQGRFPARANNPYFDVPCGFAIAALLQVASLRWAWWPLLPVGFVTSDGAFIQNAWFSVFVGWMVKVLLVRFGGASLYQKARPVFVGIIFGEGLAAGFWLVVNAIVVLNGGDSTTVKFLF